MVKTQLLFVLVTSLVTRVGQMASHPSTGICGKFPTLVTLVTLARNSTFKLIPQVLSRGWGLDCWQATPFSPQPHCGVSSLVTLAKPVGTSAVILKYEVSWTVAQIQVQNLCTICQSRPFFFYSWKWWRSHAKRHTHAIKSPQSIDLFPLGTHIPHIMCSANAWNAHSFQISKLFNNNTTSTFKYMLF